MFIFLDSSAEEELVFILVNKNIKIEKIIFKNKKARQGPLFCFNELIEKKKIKLKEILGIGVLIGRGRFTATRIAVTFGNFLSFFLKKPIVGLSEFDVCEFLKQIKKAKKGIYLSAQYSGEANIGKSKKEI